MSKKKVLIVGNGSSALLKLRYIQLYSGDLWVCNQWFLYQALFPKIKVVGACDFFIYTIYDRTKDALALDKMRFLTARHQKGILESNGFFEGYEFFKKDRNWLTGSQMIEQACIEGFEKIDLLGFDLLKSSSIDNRFSISDKCLYPDADYKRSLEAFKEIQAIYPHVEINLVS